MSDTISLSSVVIPDEKPYHRESPRPMDLRQPEFNERFDWKTLFYDIYRVGPFVVFQGPPLLNLLPLLREYPYFRKVLRPILGNGRHIAHNKRGEIWVRSTEDSFRFEGPFGSFERDVQPNGTSLFAGKRVVTTISKDNRIEWIKDWIKFYVREHQADAILLYDNGSTLYCADDLQSELSETFPDIFIKVVSWPFPFGMDGGVTRDGRPIPWDSDYCQVGSMHHARFRFLEKARSVLNVDVDEIVVGSNGQSIFAETEASRSGLIKFDGRWIGTASSHPVKQSERKHGDFFLRDPKDQGRCPPKWCLVPTLQNRYDWSWSPHNIFGSKDNKYINPEFTYRHMRSISTDWKYKRSQKEGTPAADCSRDEALFAAFNRTDLLHTAD